MKPDWDKLGNAYADSASVLIVDADCTGPAQGACQKHGVQGYPTIKYFMAGKKSGTAYNGGRDFSSLKSFVAKTLDKPMCDALTKKNCLPNEIKYIDGQKDKSLEELQAELKVKTDAAKEIKDARKAAEKELKEKEKEWKKKEKLLSMATGILKQFEKQAKAGSKAKTDL